MVVLKEQEAQLNETQDGAGVGVLERSALVMLMSCRVFLGLC